MGMQDRVGTGSEGFDRMIDMLRLGDNVVWQIDSVSSYKKMAETFAAQALRDGRKLVYVRFGRHGPLLGGEPGINTCRLDAGAGFENFAASAYSLVEREGRKTFYVFDCLTDLLESWHSDLMIGNFFKIICPYLYKLDTVAYFSIMRNAHTYGTIAGIRETTQLLLDLYHVNDRHYVHPIKVWQRYSPTMFLPHLVEGNEARCITSSYDAAELFSHISRNAERLDYWHTVLAKAQEALSLPTGRQEEMKKLLMSMLVGEKSRISELCGRYFSLRDIVDIALREAGTGFIGGKSVGMLLARKILEREGGERFASCLEAHDSFYLGSDVFYTYIVQNGWWELRMKQKTGDGYFKYAPELKEKILGGRFPGTIREQFVQVLDYFGQSPIIVRSSSLLEDNYGNAFAGKYESVFCANQGAPEERLEAFEHAVRTVYASMLNEDALAYRINRGLFDRDEQMAILVQRVSGDYCGDYFFPHAAGVGNSSNLYVWDKDVDMNAGMLRMVFGLGTRAVDRAAGDYARIVCLDDPMRMPPVNYEDRDRYTQHCADVISLRDNALKPVNLADIAPLDIKADKNMFFRFDRERADRLAELGHADIGAAYVLDFRGIFENTSFHVFMKDVLATLSKAYNYPVDIEFTVNFSRDGSFRVNILQCRPLQTKGLGKPVKMPETGGGQKCFFASRGNFMGGNVRLPIDFVVYVGAKEYMLLSEHDKYEAARQIGMINSRLKGKSVMLVGPGRWGTTTPSLGVPVHFSEICNMAVLCEVASTAAGFVPELSYGSHFFQDIVETGIFYAALFAGQPDVEFHPEAILEKENMLEAVLGRSSRLAGVIHVAETSGMELYSDIVTQKVICL